MRVEDVDVPLPVWEFLHFYILISGSMRDRRVMTLTGCAPALTDAHELTQAADLSDGGVRGCTIGTADTVEFVEMPCIGDITFLS